MQTFIAVLFSLLYDKHIHYLKTYLAEIALQVNVKTMGFLGVADRFLI